MSGEQIESPGSGTARFTLKVQDHAIEVGVRLPEGPVLPGVLLPVLQNLSDSLSQIVEERAAKAGHSISCRAGCGACCRQAVPISPVEARMLSEWLAEQPEERRAVLRERFRRAAERLEETGIAQRIREAPRNGGREAMHELGLQYFALGIPCPFLEEESCSIHEIRPLRCREYLVVSPPEHCAHPENKEIAGIKPPVLLSPILGRWSVDGNRGASEWILLTMLEGWAMQHPAAEDHPHRTAPELLQEFLRGFASDPDPAPVPGL